MSAKLHHLPPFSERSLSSRALILFGLRIFWNSFLGLDDEQSNRPSPFLAACRARICLRVFTSFTERESAPPERHFVWNLYLPRACDQCDAVSRLQRKRCSCRNNDRFDNHRGRGVLVSSRKEFPETQTNAQRKVSGKLKREIATSNAD